MTDAVAAFIEAACFPPRGDHGSGTLEEANNILASYPEVAASNIHAAAIIAEEEAVRRFLVGDPAGATAKGGPHEWDALTQLCFSRYLRLDKSRSDAFLRTARALLEAGASANTGWIEMLDHPTPRPVFESAIYGAAGIAQHPDLTRLLLEFGADPNDEETGYHVPETRDNTVLKILLDSGKLNGTSLTTMLARKADWHDEDGLRMVLKHGADPNAVSRWGRNALQHALLRDNALSTIELLLDYGASPRSGLALAARRGRGDVLEIFEKRGMILNLSAADRIIADCARGKVPQVRDPQTIAGIVNEGGTLLAEFAGNGNADGIRCLLDLGVSPSALYKGDGYFEISTGSTALHVAGWRARHATVKELIAHGVSANARDAQGRTALALAVKACVDSYWKDRRSPESIEALLQAGATTDGIAIPTGYDAADELLRQGAQS